MPLFKVLFISCLVVLSITLTKGQEMHTISVNFNQPDFCGEVTSLENHQNQIKFYPNPAANKIFIESMDNGVVQIMDLSGKTLLEKKIVYGSNLLNIEFLASGIYLLYYHTEKYQINFKLQIE